MMSDELYVNLEWLPRVPDDFNEQLQTATQEKTSGSLLRKLAGYALHINQIHRIAKVIAIAQKSNKDLRPLQPFSLGIVSNATTSIIVPALVATAARHGFSLTVHEAPYGQADALRERNEYIEANNGIQELFNSSLVKRISNHE